MRAGLGRQVPIDSTKSARPCPRKVRCGLDKIKLIGSLSGILHCKVQRGREDVTHIQPSRYGANRTDVAGLLLLSFRQKIEVRPLLQAKITVQYHEPWQGQS
jgi:hypothetical protein